MNTVAQLKEVIRQANPQSVFVAMARAADLLVGQPAILADGCMLIPIARKKMDGVFEDIATLLRSDSSVCSRTDLELGMLSYHYLQEMEIKFKSRRASNEDAAQIICEEDCCRAAQALDRLTKAIAFVRLVEAIPIAKDVIVVIRQ